MPPDMKLRVVECAEHSRDHYYHTALSNLWQPTQNADRVVYISGQMDIGNNKANSGAAAQSQKYYSKLRIEQQKAKKIGLRSIIPHST